jgi:hypothetical protein
MKAIVAAFLSFLLNGLGQIYNGQIKKAFIFIFVSFVFIIALVVGLLLVFKSFLLMTTHTFGFTLLAKGVLLITVSGFILCLNALVSIVDAYTYARSHADKSKSST